MIIFFVEVYTWLKVLCGGFWNLTVRIGDVFQVYFDFCSQRQGDRRRRIVASWFGSF